MRKDDQIINKPNYFDSELKTTEKILNRQEQKDKPPVEEKTLIEWSKILNKKITTRKKDDIVIQEGFQISFLLTREGDFEILEEVQKYAKENCGGNVTLAFMQLSKKGLKK